MKNKKITENKTEKTIGEYLYTNFLIKTAEKMMLFGLLLASLCLIIAHTAIGVKYGLQIEIAPVIIMISWLMVNVHRRSFLQLVNHTSNLDE